MGAFISVEVDIQGAQKALEGTKKSLKSVQMGVLRIVARGTVKAIKSGIRTSGIQKRTGELLKCYGYKVKKNGSEVNIFPKGKGGSRIFPKVYVLNYGLPGTGHRPHSFIEKGQNYTEGNFYENEIDKYIQKELEKYWGQNGTTF